MKILRNNLWNNSLIFIKLSPKNKFTVSINNVYNVESKPVKVYTPTEPKKDVFKGSDITSIDSTL